MSRAVQPPTTTEDGWARVTYSDAVRAGIGSIIDLGGGAYAEVAEIGPADPAGVVTITLRDATAYGQAMAHLQEALAAAVDRMFAEGDPGSITVTLDNSDGRFYPDEPRRQWWECSHAGEPCRCDEVLTCICEGCTRKRWPNEPGHE